MSSGSIDQRGKTMPSEPQSASARTLALSRHSRWIAGLALIAIGLLVLVEQYVESEWLRLFFLPALGAIFLLWGSITRSIGLLIPGGILGGIGLGVVLNAGPLESLGGDAEGGVFLLSFALGWGLITLLSALVTQETHWWPLIPGGIMAAIGGALLAGGAAMDALNVVGNLLGRAWPLGLVALGLYLLLRHKESPE